MKSVQPDRDFEALLEYLQRTRGFDFTAYKRPSLMRRVTKRMQMIKIDKFSDYMDYLEVHPDEFAQLFDTILINVTAFYRDQPSWDFLAQEVIAKMLKEKKPDGPIRVWSAGCASGEEAYTIAILLAEALGPDAFRDRVKIYATDVDEEALSHARHASYGEKDLEPVSQELREKYFEHGSSRLIFRNDLRRSVIFGRHDLVQDAPISRLDLLICRNTLMYFNAEIQARILARFHFALNDPGYLFLGRAEMLLTHTNIFTPVELKCRIFSKVPKMQMRDRLLVLAQAGNMEVGNHLARQMRVRDITFESSPSAQIAIDADGNLTLASERARSLFGLSQRDVGRPFQDLELSYRPVDLRSLMDRCINERRIVKAENVQRSQPDGTVQIFEIQLTPLVENGTLLGVNITFNDQTRYYKLQEDLQRHQQELETAYEELQSANEELETTNEELQSTNEELETTNEELQSSNEELETMNEELQSTNEELSTINEELRQRTEELNQTNAFLQSILRSLHSGVVVLDARQSILSWNHRAEDLWGLRADEVHGHSLMSLDIGLPLEKLRTAIRACFIGESNHEEVIVDATNRRGKAIKCRVTCTPIAGPNQEQQGTILMMEELE
ncbi:MAG TPA: CheR family methyltransferase [Thermodesulfobacteriota bacterium]|jgi:two-component system CheB/CheR fusion protein|nr:CheR family methyltransferase [Thermodesulfobacteriota bacterium]